jgi:hypothetical protein
VSEKESECTVEGEESRSIQWQSIRSITAHSHDLCREIGAFGGSGELHLLLWDRGLVVPAAHFFHFENRVNGEWAEKKGRRFSNGVAHLMSSAGDWIKQGLI